MLAEYHVLTASDVKSAVAFYNEKGAGLGDQLRREIYQTIDNILLNPLRYAVVEHDIRRSFVHRFPYSVLFRIVSTEVVRILVVRHHRRHSRFGLARV